jgi:hypothetical protein
MIKKLASLSIITALICTLGGVPAFAQSPATFEVKVAASREASVARNNSTATGQTRQSLKAEIAKAVADARAGRGLKVSDPQNQPAQSNSLSKTAKIAIAVGVGLAIVLAIIAINFKRNGFG